jgi:hypothetical protein
VSNLLEEHVVFGVRADPIRGGQSDTETDLHHRGHDCAGADSIDDLDVIRAGGMKNLFSAVYAPATMRIFLREFTHGHTRQLASLLRRHLSALAKRTDVLDGSPTRRSWTSIRCYVRSTAAPNKALRSGTRTSRTNRYCVRDCLQ